MTTFSKFFTDQIQNITCQDLYHPWTSSCSRAWIDLFISSIPGAVKLFAPFVLPPLLYNGWDNDLPFVMGAIENLVRMLINAFGSVMCGLAVACLLKQILGKFYLSTIVVLPSTIISPISFILPSSLRKTHSQALFGFVLEAAIKNSKSSIIKTLRKSKAFTTLLFMCISGSIMYYLKRDNYPLYWFIRPTKNKTTTDDFNNNIEKPFKRYIDNPEFPGWGQLKLTEKLCCDHRGRCDKHALDGLLTYGKLSIGFEIIKRIISSVDLIKTNPIKGLRNIVISTNYKFVKFIVSYAVLYRIVNCFFNRKFGEETPKSSLLAGFVAGLAFSFAPNYYFFTYGFSTMVQLMWHALGMAEPQRIPHFEKLYNLPWSVITYGIFGGLMFHIRMFKPQLLPKLAVKVNDMMSNGHMERISARINELAMTSV